VPSLFFKRASKRPDAQGSMRSRSTFGRDLRGAAPKTLGPKGPMEIWPKGPCDAAVVRVVVSAHKRPSHPSSVVASDALTTSATESRLYSRKSAGGQVDLELKLALDPIADRKQLDHLQTEAATSTARVLPFLAALGYDVFNPAEVVPEFTADFHGKKCEKVD